MEKYVKFILKYLLGKIQNTATLKILSLQYQPCDVIVIEWGLIFGNFVLSCVKVIKADSLALAEGD